jgi:drug/metabolite transporter superfamily protein YnfA
LPGLGVILDTLRADRWDLIGAAIRLGVAVIM